MADFIHALLQIIGAGVAAYAVPYLVTRGIADGIKAAGTINVEWRRFERRL